MHQLTLPFAAEISPAGAFLALLVCLLSLLSLLPQPATASAATSSTNRNRIDLIWLPPPTENPLGLTTRGGTKSHEVVRVSSCPLCGSSVAWQPPHSRGPLPQSRPSS